MKYTIIDKPNFKYEAVSCITQYYTSNESEIIENHDNFNLTEEEMKDFLKDYSKYKSMVTEEILPIYKEYPKLDKIFKIQLGEDIVNSPIILPLSIAFKDVIFNENNLDIIDEKLNSFLENYIMSSDEKNFNSNVKINNFEDLLSQLNIIDFDNSQKMILIDLYYNRYELIKDYLEFVDRASKICENHFSIIENDFNATYEHLFNLENIEEYIQKSVGVHFKINNKSKLFISILGFNVFSMFETDSISLGIYFFKLIDFKKKSKSNFLDLAAELKALADPTRLNMISLLSKENLYIQEMAEILNLTPATISHHTSILLKHNLISIHIDAEQSKKIFYTVNPSKLNSLGDVIKDLSNLN